MLVKERRCDLCGKVVSQRGDTRDRTLRLRYKAKQCHKHPCGLYGWVARWARMDICPGCLDRIIAERRSDGRDK